MPSRWFTGLLVFAALLVPAAAQAAMSGPAVPETITLPSKVVEGDSASGTVCLDRVPDASTEVLLFTDNSFAGTVEPTSVVITPPEQCAAFTVHTSITGFARELNLIVSAFANGTPAQQVLPIIPFAGYDLVEVTRAAVNGSFTKLTVEATSDEPGAVLTAFTAGVELGQLEQKGNRYVGRFEERRADQQRRGAQQPRRMCAARAAVREQLDALLTPNWQGRNGAPPAKFDPTPTAHPCSVWELKSTTRVRRPS
jgi:hypothetical protein